MRIYVFPMLGLKPIFIYFFSIVKVTLIFLMDYNCPYYYGVKNIVKIFIMIIFDYANLHNKY